MPSCTKKLFFWEPTRVLVNIKYYRGKETCRLHRMTPKNKSQGVVWPMERDLKRPLPFNFMLCSICWLLLKTTWNLAFEDYLDILCLGPETNKETLTNKNDCITKHIWYLSGLLVVVLPSKISSQVDPGFSYVYSRLQLRVLPVSVTCKYVLHV